MQIKVTILFGPGNKSKSTCMANEKQEVPLRSDDYTLTEINVSNSRLNCSRVTMAIQIVRTSVEVGSVWVALRESFRRLQTYISAPQYNNFIVCSQCANQCKRTRESHHHMLKRLNP